MKAQYVEVWELFSFKRKCVRFLWERENGFISFMKKKEVHRIIVTLLIIKLFYLKQSSSF